MLRSTVTPPLFPYTTLFRSNGKSLPDRNERGEQIVDDVLLLLVNGAEDEQQFVLPQAPVNSWEVVLDTNGIASLGRSEEHTSELQSRDHLVCRLLLEKKN